MNSTNQSYLAAPSLHAQIRMNQRGISQEKIDLTLAFGRRIRGNGIICYVVGKKEVANQKNTSIDLRGAEGVHVLVAQHNESQIITTYRNKNLSNLRPIIKRRN
ncbi:DUF4258 domain-containing protein [Pelagibaculum spongiae]|uniref:DUF4258 domain-containing protein n=1 Tax=Pelagibaculum spongiae TaxID=2080658 RepID=A0A2V1GWB0_9GAMM|nr:DUF4258 domain-containing protein [Pelagibaculum spongiae]PVZ64508.1 hypothetical protein DC094_19540 [Pelagibaculum spongiae]